uniref:Uncharacterized protein n=1 Tax=Alexandrium monilatum TaxID=311494 RepID=A0A7S4RZJ5_9DINO
MPPVYKDSTYDAAALWCEETAIAYGENRKRNPSKAAPVGSFPGSSRPRQDLFFDFEHGMLRIVGPPFRSSPLDLTKVLPEDATDFERAMAKSVGRAALTKRTEVVAERLGLDKKDLGNDREDGETLEMHGQRKEAVASAKAILEAAERECRRVTDEEVRTVLSQWAFKNNDSRQNVLPEGHRFVKSDTLGLIPLRDGTVQVTRMTREYPEVCQLFCRWLKDHTPADLGEDHVFTSINVNSGYAAKLHRDAGNVGPSMIKAFGKFSGGRLRYWPDDDQHRKLEEVRQEHHVELNLSESLALFNGSCAHEVEPFEGERFSLVYFSVSKFARADLDSRKVCLDCGINMPTAESMERARRVLPPPRGYAVKGARAHLQDGPAGAQQRVRFWRILDGGAGPARAPGQATSASDAVGVPAAGAASSSGPSGRSGAGPGGAASAAAPRVAAGADGAAGAQPRATGTLPCLLAKMKAAGMKVIEVEDEATVPLRREPVQASTPCKDAKRPAIDAIDASVIKRPRPKPAGDGSACGSGSYAQVRLWMTGRSEVEGDKDVELSAVDEVDTSTAKRPAEAADSEGPACSSGTYAQVRLWMADTRIEYVPGGKRQGAASFEHYEKYSKATTVSEALELGSRPRDLLSDYEGGLLKVVGGPVRSKPLDLIKAQDLAALTYTDKVLARTRSE